MSTETTTTENNDLLGGIFQIQNDFAVTKGTDLVSTTLKLWSQNMLYMAIYTIAAMFLGVMAISNLFPKLAARMISKKTKDYVKYGEDPRRVN